MKKDFQLNIPEPCHENWADMRPEEMGQWVADSLSMLGILPKKLLVYANPVRKGIAVSLNWLGTEPRQYAVEIFNSSGAVVQRRVTRKWLPGSWCAIMS